MKTRISIIIAALLAILTAVLTIAQINPTNSDIPRHLLSGRLMLESIMRGQLPTAVWYTNAFSYTAADFPFVNHHWLSAAVFYLIYAATAWTGIHLLYLVLIAAAAYFAVRLALQKSPIIMATVAVWLMVLPLLTSRTEVRPEGWSYLFLALYTYILSSKSLSKKQVAIILVSQLFWANLHIYFVLGVGLIWLYALRFSTKRPYIGFTDTRHMMVAGVAIIISLLNPHGIKGFLYPFTIFQNYGYDIVENKSVYFLWNWGMKDPLFIHVTVMTLIVLVLVVRKRQTDWRLGMVALATGLWGMWGIRNFPITGLMMLPYLTAPVAAGIAWTAKVLRTTPRMASLVCVLVVFVATLFLYGGSYQQQLGQLHLGAISTEKSDRFLTTYAKKARLYNNYDVGSYLEWLVYPTLVYVDNRPEAFPVSFFTDEYKRMDSDAVFNRVVKRDHIDMIVFQYRDLTPWSQVFLQQRFADPQWVPVYADERIIVLARDQAQNAALIKSNRMPKELFQFGTQ